MFRGKPFVVGLASFLVASAMTWSAFSAQAAITGETDLAVTGSSGLLTDNVPTPDGLFLLVTEYQGQKLWKQAVNGGAPVSVPTVGVPYAVAVTPDSQRAVVASVTFLSSAGGLTFVDFSTNSAVGLTGGEYAGLAISPDGRFVYASNINSNSLDVYEISTRNLLAQISVGTAPWGVAMSSDGTKVFVANNGSDNVSVISTSTNSVIQTIAVGTAPMPIVSASVGNKVFVGNSVSNTVSVIDATTYTVSNPIDASASGNGLRGLDVSPDASQIAISQINSDVIRIYSTQTYALIESRTLTLTSGAPWSLHYAGTGGHLYVGLSQSATVADLTISPALAIAPRSSEPPSPSSTRGPTLPSTGLNALQYFAISGVLFGGGVFALVIAVALRRRIPSRSE